MRTRTVLVAHRRAMFAEGIAAGLAAIPGIAAVGCVTSAADALRASPADAAVIDRSLAGAEQAANALRARGVRVVMLGEPSDDDDEVVVSPASSIATLAAALVPGSRHRGGGLGRLSARERQVLALVGRGLAGKQVARHLGISPKTVEHHKSRIFSKLGAANQAAAVRLAIDEELGRSHGTWTRSRI